MTREDCNIEPGGEVRIVRDGQVIWSRVLCRGCFEMRRANTEASRGVAVVKRSDEA